MQAHKNKAQASQQSNLTFRLVTCLKLSPVTNRRLVTYEKQKDVGTTMLQREQDTVAQSCVVPSNHIIAVGYKGDVIGKC
jgi:hypothetical protein